MSEHYTVASGQAAHGGRRHSVLPAWVPSPGQLASINLNELGPLDPDPTHAQWYYGNQQAPWLNWNGAAFADEYGVLGAMVYWGGGHGGGDQTEAYLFDFNTRLWRRVGKTPDTPFTISDSDEWYDAYMVVDGVENWFVPGLHTYCYPFYIKPSLDGTPMGSYCLPVLVAWTTHSAPHAINLATGQMRRSAANTQPINGANGPYSGVIHDTNRGRVFWGAVSENGYSWMDLNEPEPRAVYREYGHDIWWGGYYSNFVFVPELDIAFGFNYEAGKVCIQAFSLATGVPQNVAGGIIKRIDLTLANNGFGIDWCPDTQAFYLYAGVNATTIYKITGPAGDRISGDWTITTEAELVGIASNGDAGNGGHTPFNRWRYNKALKSFMWSEGPVPSGMCADGVVRNSLMQLYRPVGT